MKQTMQILLTIAALAALSACGGGGDAGVINGGGGSSAIAASFVADQPNPQAGDVAMAQGATNGNLVTVRLTVTNVNDVFGGSLDVSYDSASASYVGWQAGNLLEPSGSVSYTVSESPAGTVLVGAALNGSASAVDVSGTRTLVQLTFRVDAEGTFPVSIANAELFDGQTSPQTLPGLTWHSGSLSGQK